MDYGPARQLEIANSCNVPWPLRLPVAYEEWEARAGDQLDFRAFDYVAEAAGGETTQQADVQAFQRRQIVPRFLRDVASRNFRVSLLGHTFPSPVLIAPIGRQTLFHPLGELAAARAAASLGVPFVLSTESSYSIEHVAAAMGASSRWFQLYWTGDDDVTRSFIRRAEKAGYSAVVVTVDRPSEGWGERDLRNAYFPAMFPHAVANYVTDPVFLSKLPQERRNDRNYVLQEVFRIFYNPKVTWKHIAELKTVTKLPVLLKGIVHPKDAERALACGVDGIIVSNHSGRQLDGTVPALDALPAVCRAVRSRVPVLMDSGIRRGSDVIKALALGADAVLVGKLYVYALAVAGEVGVRTALQNLLGDLDISMGNAGVRSVRDIDATLLSAALDLT